MSRIPRKTFRLDMSTIPRKTMFRLEKFFPMKCPTCQHWLGNRSNFGEPAQFAFLFGDIKAGKKVPRQPEGLGCDIIICNKCEKCTLRVMLEVRQVSSLAEAERLFSEEGFRRVSVVEAYGNLTQDHKIVYYEAGKMVGQVQFLNPLTK